MGKKKQLVEELAQKEQAIARLSRQVEELNAQLRESGEKLSAHQARELAVVNALTEAEGLAKTKIEGAEKWADEIVAQAVSEKSRIQQEGEAITMEAKQQAESIIAGARGQAQEILGEAESSLAAFRASAENFNRMLEDASASAQAQASAFEGAIRQLKIPDAEVATLESALERLPEADALPEAYESPAELMHSIYAIEGREMPESVEGAEQEAHVWTIDEIKDEVEKSELEFSVDDELSKLIEDVLK